MHPHQLPTWKRFHWVVLSARRIAGLISAARSPIAVLTLRRLSALLRRDNRARACCPAAPQVPRRPCLGVYALGPARWPCRSGRPTADSGCRRPLAAGLVAVTWPAEHASRPTPSEARRAGRIRLIGSVAFLGARFPSSIGLQLRLLTVPNSYRWPAPGWFSSASGPSCPGARGGSPTPRRPQRSSGHFR